VIGKSGFGFSGDENQGPGGAIFNFSLSKTTMKLLTTFAVLGAAPFAILAINLDKQSLPSELQPYAGAQNNTYSIAKMLHKDPLEPLDVGKILKRAFSRLSKGGKITKESLLRKYNHILKKMKMQDNQTFTDEFLQAAAQESIAQVGYGNEINLANFTAYFIPRLTQPVPVYPELCTRVRQELAPCMSSAKLPFIKRVKNRSNDMLDLCDRGMTALTSYTNEKCVLIKSGLAAQGANNQTCTAAFSCYLTGKDRSKIESDVSVSAKPFDLSPKEFGMTMFWWQILWSGHYLQYDRLRQDTIILTVVSIVDPPLLLASFIISLIWAGKLADSREDFFQLMRAFNEYSEQLK
jgi:hypothetical protein